jgi:F-type H+-transporting ATPase subunit alpha
MYLEPDLFNAGNRPALNVGLSVSRVGSTAQTKAMKQVAGKLRLELAQYRELAAFAQFGTSELDKATRAQLDRGQRITEILKQVQFMPMSLEKQVMILYVAINGYLEDVAIDKVALFETKFHEFMESSHPEIGRSISETKEINAKNEEALKKAILEFKELHYTELFRYEIK